MLSLAGVVWVESAAPALADRHCSFARQSAFYAREFSDEARTGPDGECRSKTAEALDRLRDAMAELEICSCAAAEEPLRRWLRDRPPPSPDPGGACVANARSINAISKTVLTRVETCF